VNKPHVLVLSPHVGIAEGLVRLLMLEGRYEVRRAASPLEEPTDWHADVVLVDGSLLRNGLGVLSLPAPALVLSGTREDAEALLARVPTAKGWLRKDPTYPELERALASIGITTSAAAVRPRVSLAAILAFAVAFVGVVIAVLWLLFK